MSVSSAEGSQDLDLDLRVLESVMRMTADLLQVRRCSLMLLEEGTDELTVVCAHGMDDTVRRQARVRVGEDVAGRVVESGQPLSSLDFPRGTAPWPDKQIRYDTQAFLSQPVRICGPVAGAFSIADPANVDQFDNRDMERATTIRAHLEKCLESLQARGALGRRWTHGPAVALWTRDQLRGRLEEELARARRYHYPVSLLVLTPAPSPASKGDRSVDAIQRRAREMAAAVRPCTRRGDVLVSYGAGRVAAILVQAEGRRASLVATRLLRCGSTLEGGEGLGQSELRVGISSFPEPSTTAEQMLADAERVAFGAVGPSASQVTEEIPAAGLESEATLRVQVGEGRSKPHFLLPEDLPSENIAKRIPLELAKRYLCVPVAEEDGVLTVATVDGTSETLKEVQEASGLSLYVVWSSEDCILRALRRMEKFHR